MGGVQMRGTVVNGLVLYKRHSAGCEVHATKLSEPAKRFYFECTCPIWINGTIPGTNDVMPRQATGEKDLKRAEAFRDAQIASRTRITADNAVMGPSISACIEQYLAAREHELNERTHMFMGRILSKLSTYCSARGVLYMSEVTVDLLERFKIEGLAGLSNTTKRHQFQKIIAFLRVAFRREWIKTELAARVRPHAAVSEQKQPYTDDEVTAILNASENIKLRSGGKYSTSPKTFRTLLELMLATGMRIGDAIMFDPAKLTRGESVWIYTYEPQKQKRIKQARSTVEAYVTDALKSAIESCTWMTPGRWPFYYGPVTEHARYYLSNEAYRLMHGLSKRSGVADCRPHRLRDTFAVRCLRAGMSLEDVSRLLNHSSVVVTEKYYAAWTRERRLRLERSFTDAIVNGGGHRTRNRKSLPTPR
jgi:integrase/recombinase XerD